MCQDLPPQLIQAPSRDRAIELLSEMQVTVDFKAAPVLATSLVEALGVEEALETAEAEDSMAERVTNGGCVMPQWISPASVCRK